MVSTTRARTDRRVAVHDAALVDPDADILERIDRGDATTALRMVMARHGDEVYRYCREGLHDATLADDVHQQVFIAAHRDLPRFERRSSLRTWLFGIARHRMLDAAKARRRAFARLARLGPPADAEDLQPPAPVLLDDARLQAALRGCLEDLDERVRTAILLRYQQGFTFNEMAEICNEKPGTLEARVRRALRVLRKCIERRIGKELI